MREPTRLLAAVERGDTAKVAETTLPPETAELTTTVCKVPAGVDDGTSVKALVVPIAVTVSMEVGALVFARGGLAGGPSVIGVVVTRDICALVTVLLTGVSSASPGIVLVVRPVTT